MADLLRASARSQPSSQHKHDGSIHRTDVPRGRGRENRIGRGRTDSSALHSAHVAHAPRSAAGWQPPVPAAHRPRPPSTPRVSDTPPRVPVPRGRPHRPDRLVVVVDVNGVLLDRVRRGGGSRQRSAESGQRDAASATDGTTTPTPAAQKEKGDIVTGKHTIFLRPHARDFCEFLLDRFDVVVWSSMLPQNIALVLPHVFGRRTDELMGILDQRHCDVMGSVSLEGGGHKPRFAKPLERVWTALGGDAHTTLLIDDDKYKATLNPPHTAIHPPAFQQGSEDDLLAPHVGALWRFLDALSREKDIPSFVERGEFEAALESRHDDARGSELDDRDYEAHMAVSP